MWYVILFQGGTKLLLIGPWTKVSSTYTCVIDGEPVQTSLLQPGVLRCYTPGKIDDITAATNTYSINCKVKCVVF